MPQMRIGGIQLLRLMSQGSLNRVGLWLVALFGVVLFSSTCYGQRLRATVLLTGDVWSTTETDSNNCPGGGTAVHTETGVNHFSPNTTFYPPFQLIKENGAWLPATQTTNSHPYAPGYIYPETKQYSLTREGLLTYTDRFYALPIDLVYPFLYNFTSSSTIWTLNLENGTFRYTTDFANSVTRSDQWICSGYLWPSTSPQFSNQEIAGRVDGTLSVSFQALQNEPLTVTFGTTTNPAPYSMFDSHTFRANVTGHFSQDPTTAKSLSVNTTINGIPVSSIYPLSSSAIGDQPTSLFIDLRTAGPAGSEVPRFTDNQTFTLTATINEGNQTNTAQTDAEIPLPVVHVHGILTDCLGDRIPHEMFDYLKSQHPTYVDDPGVSNGTADNLLTPAIHPYPTLLSFDYKSLQKSVTAIAGDLDTFIKQQVLKQTYAAKVNIVAHSLGGIISRAAITFNGTGPVVNKLILVGSPTEGATYAALALNFWSTFKLVTLSAAIVDPNIANAAACILAGTQDTAKELQPTYPWWAASKTDALNGTLSIPTSSVTPVLGFLNSLGLDPGVKYYGIVAGGILTPMKLWGRNSLWPGELLAGKPPLSDNTAYEPGDGIVPLRSQEALETPWTRGALAGQLNVFDNVGAVSHTDYLKTPRVNADVNTILWK